MIALVPKEHPKTALNPSRTRSTEYPTVSPGIRAVYESRTRKNPATREKREFPVIVGNYKTIAVHFRGRGWPSKSQYLTHHPSVSRRGGVARPG